MLVDVETNLFPIYTASVAAHLGDQSTVAFPRIPDSGTWTLQGYTPCLAARAPFESLGAIVVAARWSQVGHGSCPSGGATQKASTG